MPENSRNTLIDPLGRYPKPPFPKQQQPWPGLAAQMDPRPDHGERSYRSSGQLSGRKALITGGDSGIGRAAAIAYAREGGSTIINLAAIQLCDGPGLCGRRRARRTLGLSG